MKKIPMSQEGRAKLARRKKRMARIAVVSISSGLALAVGLWSWLLAAG